MRKFFFVVPTFFFMLRLSKFVRRLDGSTVIFQDWTLTKSIDISVLLIYRFFLKYKVYTDPNEYFASLVEGRILARRWILDQLFRIYQMFGDYLLKYYTGLIIISSELEKKFSKLNENYIRIPIISDVNSHIVNELSDFKYGEVFKIAYFGTIQINKEGLDIICASLKEVIKKYENIELHLYGAIYKHERKEIKKMLSGLGTIISYKGILTNNEAREAMKKYHLLISARRLITQTKYGFSTKLAEYMSSGVPILVTNIGDNSQYIKDGENGYLVQPGSVEKFSEKLKYIIINYEKESKIIAKNALITAKHYFDYRNYSGKIVNFMFNQKD